MLSSSTITAIDKLIGDLSPQLAALQSTYRSTKGRYWQGARTHTIIPLEGLPSAPNLSLKPTDQSESWAAFGLTLPALSEAALSIETYSGPSGSGYVIHADVYSEGTLHRKSINVGPEPYRTRDWTPLKTNSMS